MKLALVTMLASCASLPHVEPDARSIMEIHSTVVAVSSRCDGVLEDKIRRGRGVLLSGRHVLTAAHVVRCEHPPSVYVDLVTGETRRMVVERDDAMFGSGSDIARLELQAQNNFDDLVIPPRLSPDFEGDVVVPQFGIGTLRGDLINEPLGRPGSSGMPVYTLDGLLVGLVTGGSDRVTVVERVNCSWLEGT